MGVKDASLQSSHDGGSLGTSCKQMVTHVRTTSVALLSQHDRWPSPLCWSSQDSSAVSGIQQEKMLTARVSGIRGRPRMASASLSDLHHEVMGIPEARRNPAVFVRDFINMRLFDHVLNEQTSLLKTAICARHDLSGFGKSPIPDRPYG
jgi:hypothetical protein